MFCRDVRGSVIPSLLSRAPRSRVRLRLTGMSSATRSCGVPSVAGSDPDVERRPDIPWTKMDPVSLAPEDVVEMETASCVESVDLLVRHARSRIGANAEFRPIEYAMSTRIGGVKVGTGVGIRVTTDLWGDVFTRDELDAPETPRK